MSTYTMTVQNKQTGERRQCTAHDDFFGPREYGYVVGGIIELLNQEEFDASWQNVQPIDSEEATEAPSHISYRYTSLRSDRTVARSVYVSQHCNVDVDADGYPIGIESF